MKIPTEPIALTELLDLLKSGLTEENARYTIWEKDDGTLRFDFQMGLPLEGGRWSIQPKQYWDVVEGETWISLRLMGSVSDAHYIYNHQRSFKVHSLKYSERALMKKFTHAIHAVLCERPIKHTVNGEERIFRIIPFDTERATSQAHDALHDLGFEQVEYHPHGPRWQHDLGEICLRPLGAGVQIEVKPGVNVVEATLLLSRAREVLTTETYAMSAGPEATRMSCAWCVDSLDVWRKKVEQEADLRAWTASLPNDRQQKVSL